MGVHLHLAQFADTVSLVVVPSPSLSLTPPPPTLHFSGRAHLYDFVCVCDSVLVSELATGYLKAVGIF